MRTILLTGEPGIGKTTIIERLASRFFSQGFKIGGFTSSEVREGGQRKGFKITDLSSGRSGWLSRKEQGTGPRVGAYHVTSGNLEEIGVGSLKSAIKDPPDLILVDEIGPMEMTSLFFRKTIVEVLSLHRPTVATIHLGAHYTEIENIRQGCMRFELTKANREGTYQRLAEQIETWIKP